MFTNWLYEIAETAFATFTRDCIVENCTFIGFAWNALEIAGPATKQCIARGLLVYGHRGHGALDVDKGASYNLVEGCIARAPLGKKLNAAESDYATVVCRIQGGASAASLTRVARGNVIADCIVDGLGGMLTGSAAFLFDRAEDSEVRDCHFNCDITAALSNGVWFGDRASRCAVIDCVVENVKGNGDGVGNQPYQSTIAANQSGNRIEGCSIESPYNGITLNNATGFALGRWVVRGNYIHGALANVGMRLYGLADVEASDNVIIEPTGASNAILLDTCARPRLVGNTVRKPSGNGIRVNANVTGAVIVGNYVSEVPGGGSQGLINSATDYPTIKGNYFERSQVADITGRRESYGAVAPTTGTWVLGDIVWNTAPAAGGTVGWICTASGTPGSWTAICYAPINGSATYDPPSLADGAGATTTVAVTGAALGDFAEASFSLDTQGVSVTAWVSAANTVSVRFQNESGGVIDLASGTLRARVRKQ